MTDDLEAWQRNQELIRAIEDQTRAIREPAERAKAQAEGEYWDRRNAWLEEQDRKRTPEERAERAAQQRQMAQMYAAEELQKAKARRHTKIAEATRAFVWTTVWLASVFR
jgi:hypothetical protein